MTAFTVHLTLIYLGGFRKLLLYLCHFDCSGLSLGQILSCWHLRATGLTTTNALLRAGTMFCFQHLPYYGCYVTGVKFTALAHKRSWVLNSAIGLLVPCPITDCLCHGRPFCVSPNYVGLGIMDPSFHYKQRTYVGPVSFEEPIHTILKQKWPDALAKTVTYFTQFYFWK